MTCAMKPSSEVPNAPSDKSVRLFSTLNICLTGRPLQVPGGDWMGGGASKHPSQVHQHAAELACCCVRLMLDTRPVGLRTDAKVAEGSPKVARNENKLPVQGKKMANNDETLLPRLFGRRVASDVSHKDRQICHRACVAETR